ncbi:MAG: substrate-binding domain-containing protein [Bacillota bacterium]|nr:substrate-binding domain-containing protein [Bacillota bacterium]
MKKVLSLLLILALLTTVGCTQQADNNEASKDIILATTTSTQDSGLLDELLPVFEKKYGYTVKTIAVGTGQALAMGESGDADVLLTHAPASELVLYEAGDIINYKLVMHNDFVIVGPATDPAGIKGLGTSAEAFEKVAKRETLFVSRGDDSGTNKKELAIWTKAGVDVGGNWYQETGSGMGQTINIASEKEGYTLTDRATYLALKENLHVEILVEGEPDLLNIYHVAQVNPEKSGLINAKGAEDFVEFMISEEAQEIIGQFGVEKFGAPLFFPDAHKDPSEYGLNY